MYNNNMNLPQDASSDQSNCPPDYYRRSNGMLHQIPAESDKPIETPDIDLASLESMTKEALISLIQRVGGAIWGYALKSDDERAEAARLKLYAMGMDSTEVHKVVPALDKWFDRTVGRAKQQIELTGKDGSPLSVRLLAIQEKYLKDVTPEVIEN